MCLADPLSHCVPLKYRKALLDEEVVRIIVEVVHGIEDRYELEFEGLGCDRDHIHLLWSAHPKIAAGQVVRVLKRMTGRELFPIAPSLKKELWGRGFGQMGMIW